MILCQSDDSKPCEICKSCIELKNDNNPDFIQIEPKDGNIKIDEVRNIQQKVLEKPVISDKKVYVITDADTMTKEAQNCLLKTLEEPPKFVTIILTGSNENMFLNTIKSRCTKIYFSKIEDEKLLNFIKEHYGFEIETSMIKACEGSIQKAIDIKDKIDIYQSVEQVFNNIEKYNLIDAINKLECIYKNKDEIFKILDYINVILLNKQMKNTHYIKYIEAVENARKNLKANSNYDMSIDNLLFNIWEE